MWMLPFMTKGTLQMWLRILKWGDEPELLGWAWYSHEGPFKREVRDQSEQRAMLDNRTTAWRSVARTQECCHLWKLQEKLEESKEWIPPSLKERKKKQPRWHPSPTPQHVEDPSSIACCFVVAVSFFGHPMAWSSRPRDQIGATVVRLHQCWIPNSLCQGWDWTCVPTLRRALHHSRNSTSSF